MSGHFFNKYLNTQYFDSPIGLLRIEARSSGITAVTFCDADDEPGAAHPSEHTQQCVQELQEYFAGERKVFSCVLSPSGTSFQQHAWQLLQQIPYGTTVSYKTQALRSGDANSIRAIAAANGKNPIAILIPCHRVVGVNGKLTGYSGGLWRKQWLLEHEAYVATGFRKLV